jgi:hypothetical protein
LSGTWRWNGKNSGQCLAILFGFGEIKRNIIRVLTGQLIPAQFVLRRLREYYVAGKTFNNNNEMQQLVCWPIY